MQSHYPDSNKALDQKPPAFVVWCNERRWAPFLSHLPSWNSRWAGLTFSRSLEGHSTTHEKWASPGYLWPVRCILVSWALKQVRERTIHTSIKHSFHLKTSDIKLLAGGSLLSPEASLFYKLHYNGTVKRFNDLNSTLDLSQMFSLCTKYQTYRLLTQTWEILSEIFEGC